MNRAALAVGLALALTLSLAGCATAPAASSERSIPDGAAVAQSVQLCQTTVDDLQRKLGTPSRDGMLGRRRVLTWIVDWEPLVRYLGVAADAQGRVVDVYWNLPSEIPWTPMDRCS